MSSLEIYIPLAIPAKSAGEALHRILKGIENADSRYHRLALSLGFRDVRIPLEGTLHVPVRAAINLRPLRWEADLEISASTASGLFPRFHGPLSVTPVGTDRAELWLQGEYVVPLGGLGRAIDATLLRGAAERSLRRFLSWLADEIRNEVERGEGTAR